jgi:hypothetical protein
MIKYLLHDNITGQYITNVNSNEPLAFITYEAAERWLLRLHIVERFTILEVTE